MPIARIAVLLAAASLAACIMFQRKAVAGEYCLDFDNETFYLRGCGPGVSLRDQSEVGPLDGTVLKIGWDQRYIIAWRRAFSEGNNDGWMILDTHAKTLEGPLSEDAWQRRQRDSTELASIVTYDVRDAWPMLR